MINNYYTHSKVDNKLKVYQETRIKYVRFSSKSMGKLRGFLTLAIAFRTKLHKIS